MAVYLRTLPCVLATKYQDNVITAVSTYHHVHSRSMKELLVLAKEALVTVCFPGLTYIGICLKLLLFFAKGFDSRFDCSFFPREEDGKKLVAKHSKKILISLKMMPGITCPYIMSFC